MSRYFAVVCCLFLACATVYADGNAEKGKGLYITCVACHGADARGNKAFNAPALAGQEDWYMVRQLKNFKSGIRGSHPQDAFGMQMRGMAMTLVNEHAIEDVVAYIKTLPPAKPDQTLTDANPDKGKSYYVTCLSCHGPKAGGNKAMGAPSLSLQADWYMVRQLSNFKAGIRGGDSRDAFGMQMRGMAMTLSSEQAIKDVVAYITTLE